MSSMTVKKAIWLGILTPILGWCAWVAWVVFNIDPNPQLYPPIAHADGSKEYRLIHREFDPSDPLIADTSTDQHWVLRFPAELAVSSLDENRTEAQKRENTDYPYNLNLDFSVGLPIFELTPNTRDIPRDDVLHVRVSAGEVRFGTGTDTSPHDTFFAQHQQRTEYSCRKDTEVFQALSAYANQAHKKLKNLVKNHYTQRGLIARYAIIHFLRLARSLDCVIEKNHMDICSALSQYMMTRTRHWAMGNAL